MDETMNSPGAFPILVAIFIDHAHSRFQAVDGLCTSVPHFFIAHRFR
jgi:hypothetical protein